MSVNVHVLDVDGSGKGLERLVIKTMHRSHQAQVFGNSLGQGLRQGMILYRQRYVTIQQGHRVQFLVVIQRIVRAPAERDHSHQLAAYFQRCNALEKFRSNVAIGAEKNFICAAVKHHRAARGGQRMHVLG